MGEMSADYTLTKLRSIGEADIYEVRLSDGSTNKFVYSNCQKKLDPSDAFEQWVAISVKRAQRDSAHRSAHG